MIALRVLLGIFQSAIFPGLSYLISTWYTRKGNFILILTFDLFLWILGAGGCKLFYERSWNLFSPCIFESRLFPTSQVHSHLSGLRANLRIEQQLRYAFLQSGEVTIVGLGAFLNYGLNHLDGKAGLRGWRWMFLVQGLVAIGKEDSGECLLRLEG
jgi:MFS family permease